MISVETKSIIEKLQLLMMEESYKIAWVEWRLTSNRKYAIYAKFESVDFYVKDSLLSVLREVWISGRSK